MSFSDLISCRSAGESRNSGRSADEYECFRRSEHSSKDRDHAASHDSRDERAESDANTGTPALRQIGVEADQDSLGIDWNDRRGDLARARQVVTASADVQPSLNRAEHARPRLPCDAIGKPALNAKAFLALHPRIYGRENFGGISTNGPRSCRDCRAGDARDESLLDGNREAHALFGECLRDRGGTDPGLFADLYELVFAQMPTRICRRARHLQFGGACEHPLDRTAIEWSLLGGKI